MELTVNYHLVELKWRFFYSALCSLVCIFIAYEFRIEILYLVSKPLINIGICEFVYTSLSEAFFTYLRLSIVSGIYWSASFWIFQIYRFLKAGVYLFEKKLIINSLSLGLIFILLGQILLWKYISPTLFKFFVSFTSEGVYDLKLLVKIQDLVKFLIGALFFTTLFFAIPGCLAFTKTYKNILNKSMKHRSIVWFIILLISAIITPPDVISQIIFGFPLILVIEISYLLTCVAGNYRWAGTTCKKSRYV